MEDVKYPVWKKVCLFPDGEKEVWKKPGADFPTKTKKPAYTNASLYGAMRWTLTRTEWNVMAKQHGYKLFYYDDYDMALREAAIDRRRNPSYLRYDK